MKPGSWESLGMIFECSAFEISGQPIVFAQAPQAVVFEDFTRVYFSSRCVHPTGIGWLSFVAYVDLSTDFSTVVSAPKRVEYTLAEPGSFDEDGIFPFSPFIDDGRFFALTTGWSRRVSVDVETGVGLMESFDGGATFSRMGRGPLLTPSTNEPFLVCDGFALRSGQKYKLWHSFGVAWTQCPRTKIWERTYKIGYRESDHLEKWPQGTGSQIIEDVRGEFECQALPTVAKVGGQFLMAFCHRDTFGFREFPSSKYDLGYAESVDGLAWRRDDSMFSFPRSDFDSEMRCYPHIFERGKEVFLLYNGNNFGQFGFGLARWTP